MTFSSVAHAAVALICELDEQRAFVGSKALQHSLWYAYNTKTGGVLAYTFGPRNDETCRELLALWIPFNIGMTTSDDWGSYAREVPKEKHLTGKIFTQRIEHNNLMLRTRIKRLTRKMICFSRTIEVHKRVIGSFIENYMFCWLEALPSDKFTCMVDDAKYGNYRPYICHYIWNCEQCPSVIGRFSFQYYAIFNESMIYHPQLVGEDYFKRVGALVDFRALNAFVI